jgi:sugar/nucleoside kinase (ribokinase family)
VAAPELLVLGHVTRDEIEGEVRLGGAAGFAARAGVMLGLQTALVTAAPADSPLLAGLRALPALSLVVVPSEAITTFALDYRGPRRRLVLRAAARPLAPADVPEAYRAAAIAYVGPVAGECGRALVESLGRGPLVCAGLQGWLRRAGPGGVIEPALDAEAASPPANLRAAVLSEEDHPDAEDIAAGLAGQGLAVALTRGARGATILAGGERHELPAAPAEERDPTGAGDVFGVVFAVALARGQGAAQAGRLAARAAARVVEGPGLGTLAPGDVSW